MPRRRSIPRRRKRDALLAQFGSNLPRHVLAVAHALMHRLVLDCEAAGYRKLRTALIQAALYLARPGTRISDLARYASISAQAAGQLVNQLGRHGLVSRQADPDDMRAHALRLTGRGRRLIAAAARSARRLDKHLSTLLGKTALAEFRGSCARLFSACLVGDSGNRPLDQRQMCSLPLALAGLATYCERELMELDKARGYTELKLSFAQVLTYISPHGSLINDLARINDISKQAIAQVVQELEALGFIERRRHPGDRRSSLIFLTPTGMRLIRVSIENIAVLEREFARVLGAPRQVRFAATLKHLAGHLQQSLLADINPGTEWSAEATLQRWIARLHLTRADATRPQLFNRAGNRVKLSAAALRILAALEIRVPD
jgi:DNA-binding MarR family transcriptional regulator